MGILGIIFRWHVSYSGCGCLLMPHAYGLTAGPTTHVTTVQTLSVIFKSGFSRIPVYAKDQNDVIGLLFTKDLIFIDPDDETPLKNFVQIFGRAVTVRARAACMRPYVLLGLSGWF